MRHPGRRRCQARRSAIERAGVWALGPRRAIPETLDPSQHATRGPEKNAPRRSRNDRVLDYSAYFVMPGLVDVHTHLAYGNAKSEEDIDLYSPLEFRTL